MSKMKNNFKVFILIMSGMFFMFSMDKILNLLFAILYGIAFMLILGSFLYIDSEKISNTKIICFHAIGVILLWFANILLISEFPTAILFSISLSIFICSIFWKAKKTGEGSERKTGDGSVS